jgi:hypothetical protein
MTGKKKAEADKAAEGISAADLEAQRARDADRDRAREAAEVAKREAEEKARRVIAILNAEGVLIGRIDGPTDAEWEKAKPERRFVNGFDNALHRYRLAEWKPGRWRFEAVVHEKDQALENLENAPQVLAPLARAVIALASEQTPAGSDVGKLVDYLKTFDAKGN